MPNTRSDSFDANYAQALDFAAQRRFDEAVVAFERAIAARPRDLSARLNLGLVFQSLERFDDAVACYKVAAAIAPDCAETQLRLASVLAQKEDLAAATAALQRAIVLDPVNARSHVQLAHILRELGELSGAEAALRRAIELDPKHVEARAHLSALLPQVGRTNEAEALLNYPLLLSIRRLDTAAGWPSVGAFNDQLAQSVLRHPTLTPNPNAAATEGGSQTLEIFNNSEPQFLALRRFIEASVADYLHGAPVAMHLLARSPASPPLLHAWAVVLSAGGRQRPHFHPGAFVSGVYYVRVPEVVKTGSDDAGFLVFGPPFPDAPRELSRSVRPQEGMLVLFPSYFWHCTVPFRGAGDRISIAFDVVMPATDPRSAL